VVKTSPARVDLKGVRWILRGSRASSEFCSSSRSSRRSQRWLFQSVLDDPAGYIAGGGKDSQIYLGAFLDFLLILANVGTAVALYPIVRRQNELLAIGYVAARIIECVFIAAGIIFVLGVVTLRQDSPDAADLAVSLAALKELDVPVRPWAHRPL